jgi:hypothetical protein
MKRNKELQRRGDLHVCLGRSLLLVIYCHCMLYSQAASQAASAQSAGDHPPVLIAQSMIPPAQEAIGGGNPFQGLGRADDPGPNRTNSFINPNTPGNGLYSTGFPSSSNSQSSFSSPAVFGGQTGSNDGSSGAQSGFGGSQNGFWGSQSSFGGADTGLGGSQNGFGSSQNSLGGSQNAFGGSQNSLGGSQNTFGGSQNSLGGSQNTFGGSQNSPGGSQNTFGGSQNTFGGSQTGAGADPNALLNQLQSALSPGAAPNLLNSSNPQSGASAGLNSMQGDGANAGSGFGQSQSNTGSTAGFGQSQGSAAGFGESQGAGAGLSQPPPGFGQPTAGFGQTQANPGLGSAAGFGQSEVGPSAGIGFGSAPADTQSLGTGSAGSDPKAQTNPAPASGFGQASSPTGEPAPKSNSTLGHSLFDDPNKFGITGGEKGARFAPPVMPPPGRGGPLGANASRLKSAISAMKMGHYAESQTLLNKIIVENPKNAEAYYVRAVVNVFMRNFKEAKADYAATISHTTDPALIDRATAGLNKLSH